MMSDEQQPFTGTMSGEISVFLTANKFRVELSDGQLVEAFVPDVLIEEMLAFYSGPPLTERISVEVEFQAPPAMHRIVKIKSGSRLCGGARAPRR